MALLQIASIACFVIIFAARVLHLLLVQKINPIAVGRGKKGFDRAFELIAFGGLIFWIIAVLLRATQTSVGILQGALGRRLLESPVAGGVGVVMIVSAILMFAFAFLSFGNSWRVGFDLQTPGALVTSGAFAFSRNPIYVALDLWFAGIALINGSLFFVGFALIAAGVLHWQMLREEAFCTKLYGEPYKIYRARTARYFGAPGPP